MGADQSTGKKERVFTLPAERAGETPIYRNICLRNPDGSSKPLISRWNPKINSVYESFMNSVKLYPQNRCLGWRDNDGPYSWINYATTHERSLALGRGLLKLEGMAPKQFFGIYSLNRPEWILCELACFTFSMVTVTLYDTLGPEACSYIVNQSELQWVACSDDKACALLASDSPMPTLKGLIIFGLAVSEKLSTIAAKRGVAVRLFEEVIKVGLADDTAPVPPTSQDILTVCYTSGTTGNPKGVMLTHDSFLADMAGAKQAGIDTYDTDVHISYLPLAHQFERMVFHNILSGGGACGFYRGNPKLLFDDMMELKPTIFPSVPRLFNILYAKVMTGVEAKGAVTSAIFSYAYSSKQEGLKSGVVTHGLWDKVFTDVREKLGGRVRLIVTGSAPIAPHIMEFLRICFSCPVIEGYGQTESCCAATATAPDSTESGNVGYPLACVEIKLVDCPHLGYYATDKPYPRGEVCFRGPICCLGYFKEEEKTKELKDEHGWLRSGDVGAILPDGSLKLVDRAKNIFKIPLGEYVAPEKLEGTFLQSLYISQCFVYGHPLENNLVAVVVANEDNFKLYAEQHNIEFNLAEMCANPEIVKFIMKDMETVGKNSKLRPFEFVKRIHVTHIPFSVEQGVLTPTFKLKRPQAYEFFKAQIDAMYLDLVAEDEKAMKERLAKEEQEEIAARTKK